MLTVNIIARADGRPLLGEERQLHAVDIEGFFEFSHQELAVFEAHRGHDDAGDERRVPPLQDLKIVVAHRSDGDAFPEAAPDAADVVDDECSGAVLAQSAGAEALGRPEPSFRGFQYLIHDNYYYHAIGEVCQEFCSKRGVNSMRIEMYEPGEGPSAIFLNGEEVKTRCRPGAGADTCVLLCMAPEGWECLFFNHAAGTTLTGEKLEERWKQGRTVAKRWGCDEIRALAEGPKEVAV